MGNVVFGCLFHVRVRLLVLRFVCRLVGLKFAWMFNSGGCSGV